jgi:UDP-glucose 4-epimerase
MVDEFLALAYYRERQLPVVVFRLFNTVGPRQTGQYGMVVPRFIEQALRGEALTVYGDGEQSRCFLHVSDAVEALIALAEAPAAVGQVFNIGSTEEISIRALAEAVLAAADGRNPIPAQPRSGGERIELIPYESAYTEGFEDMARRVPDISRIQELTGWAPRLHLDAILHDVLRSMDAAT